MPMSGTARLVFTVLIVLLLGISFQGCKQTAGDQKPDKPKLVDSEKEDGCLLRVVKFRQYKFPGGNWSEPEAVPNKGYEDGYRYVSCDAWIGTDSISSMLQQALASQGRGQGWVVENICGRSFENVDPAAAIHIRTKKDAPWRYGQDATRDQFPEYREMLIGCFAQSTTGKRCQCQDQP